MMKKTKKHGILHFIGQFIPYMTIFLVIFLLADMGSQNKASAESSDLNVNTIADNNYSVSPDQISELYVVASVSNSFDLASLDTVSGNYVTVSVMKEIAQTSTEIIEKPSLIDANISRGVTPYVVKDGETMDSIAAKFGLTTDQIRWSNNLKTTDLEPGKTLSLPTMPGIVYTVKSGDTIESLATKYGSNTDRIVAINDLEGSNVTEGMQIVLPGGILPVTERPEYVAPTPTYSSSSYGYSYYGATSDRVGVRQVYENVNSGYGNRMAPGQCTWYAWWWRATSPLSQGPLPAGLLGNANSWARNAAALGSRVDRNPEVGAVFQTVSGWYGHVGVVLAVNPDGSILVREMNYGYRAYVITESTIPANVVRNFTYIH